MALFPLEPLKSEGEEEVFLNPTPKERQAEIALLLLKQRIRTDGIRLSNIKRDVNGEAQKIGVHSTELRVFMETIYRELFEEAFTKE